MRLIFAMTLAALVSGPALAAGTKYVKPHVRSDGTYVQGHVRSAPNSSRYDNFGARNSIYGSNPYTGQRGSQRDEFSNPPAYNKPRPSSSTSPYRR